MSEEKAVPQLRFVGGTVEVPFSVEVWPGVLFAGTVRPATPGELQAFDRAVREAKDPVAKRCEFYAKHVVTWNFPDPPTAATVALVPSPVFAYLDGIVSGGTGCDMTAGAVLGKSEG